jgi:DNA invertase Pin-like site-specific DNA recombinase
VYHDEGITGTSVKKREAFNRMIADAENKEVDLILTKEVSRFARNTVDTLSFTRKLTSNGVGVIFMNDGIDTRDKDGELRLTIMASIAQEESRKTSERVKWGMRRKMEDGYVFGHSKVFGFRNYKGVLTIVPEEAEIVKRIFHEYLYDKKGTHAIATGLNNDGILTPCKKLWIASSVMRILKNDKYVGDLTQQKCYIADYLTKEFRKNKGEIPFISIENHHEAIISREVWEGVKSQIEERGEAPRKGQRHSSTYWFSSKIRCGICGKNYIICSGRTKESKGVRCRNRQAHGAVARELNGYTVGCENDGMNQICLNECMSFLLKHIKVARTEIVNDLLVEIQNMQKIETSAPINTKSLEAEIEKLNGKKHNAIDLMLEGIISKDDLRKQTELYDSEVARLTEEISNTRNADTFHKKQIDGIKECIADVSKVANFGDYTNVELYRDLIKEVIVQPDRTVDFYLNCVPFGFRMTYLPIQGGGGVRLRCDVLSLTAIE